MKIKYPLHKKLEEVQEKTQFVHDFLEWAQENYGVFLQDENGHVMSQSAILFEFIGVDRWKFEDEKREMLDELRKAAKP